MTGRSVADVPDFYQKRFEIRPLERIATAGSCFAQHISRHLRANGYSVIDAEPAPGHFSLQESLAKGYGIYSARFGNIYYAKQLEQLAREALEGREPNEVVWESGGRYYDALRPNIFPNGFKSPDLVLRHRKRHVEAVRQMLTTMDVFVFTFGLTEGWESVTDGTAYPTAPGTIAGDYDSDKYRFVNYGYQDVLASFLAFRTLVRRVNRRAKFVITVSPVPLAATATGEHVLTATTHSKAVLRTVASEIHRRCPDVDYFPSYELVTTNHITNQPFDSTGRNVRPEVVNNVMTYFFAEHHPQRKRKEEAAVDHEQLFCEEALLENFAQ
ncbi:hypothetical protein GCM10008096_26200 [Zhihengliuella salsuginis]|uniref:GSCFA domain-containing protein n=2 Tax=Zhihengliuella salsuginis TaxID=578222 RepID=A0ABQ3GLG5_9MICC|nr:hypothetical protein GCM10008096_26200 [Zhihengliuella salsuginis]